MAFSVVILGKSFNPERYSRLTELLAKRYALSGQPPRVLEAYLGAYSKDEFNFGSSGKYNAAEFDDRKSLVKCSLKCKKIFFSFCFPCFFFFSSSTRRFLESSCLGHIWHGVHSDFPGNDFEEEGDCLLLKAGSAPRNHQVSSAFCLAPQELGDPEALCDSH